MAVDEKKIQARKKPFKWQVFDFFIMQNYTFQIKP
jgi:hypothetical protein